jgi:glutathione S-transferase
MYTLYFSPGSCSLAVHALLIELGQEYKLKNVRDETVDILSVNPTGEVPVLFDGDKKIMEGAAQMIHLMEKHGNGMLPTSGEARSEVLQALMFANASVHGAYSKGFMAKFGLENEAGKAEVLALVTKKLNIVWGMIDEQLAKTEFVAGNDITAADFFLTVYTNWTAMIGVEVTYGKNVERMVEAVRARPSFQQAMKEEGLI